MPTLRAKKPEAVQKRLKMFMFGPAGVGKTTAAIQFPNSYIIDCEKGTENYEKIITASGSVVFQTTEIAEVLQEVKTLLTTKHEYRTLVIDPITTVYNDLLDKAESKVGSDHGRHYGEAGKTMKRLANLIMALDMNVILTAHAKAEYGQNLSKLGYTFDGWKQLDYWFDLVIELGKKGKKRMAKVVKTRLDTFPDDDVFEWSYDAVRRRYDPALLEREAGTASLATAEQVREIKDLLALVRLPEGTPDKWFAKAGVDLWEDFPAEMLARCIEYVKGRLPSAAAAAGDASTGEDLLADDARFESELNAAFQSRGFKPSDADKAKTQIAAAYGVGTTDKLDGPQRHTVLAAVRAGKADKYKAQPVTAVAGK